MSARPLIAVAALVALLAACSGDDDAASDTTTEAPSTSAAATTTPPTTSPPTTAAPTTMPPTTAALTTVATTAPPTTLPEPLFDDWCGVAVVVAERDALRDDVDFTDPAAVEEYLEPVPGLLAQALLLAPDEIADAVAVSTANSLAIYEALQGNGFDMLTLDLADAGVDLEAGDAAVEEIDAYNEAVCGIPIPDAGDDDGSVDLGDGSLRDLFLAQLVDAGFSDDEAECLFDALDFGDVDAITDDAVEGAFAACEIDLERIDELSTILGG